MNSELIEVRNVRKRYGDLVAVDGVDLTIGRGEIFGLIGQNGAGKSTLFKMMLGLLPPTSGEILIDGDAPRGRGFRDVRRHMGYLPENVAHYDNLTGLEILRFFARLKGVDTRGCGSILERVGLSFAANRKAGGYSKGMRQRLGLGLALLGKPKILFLDEPTTGLDPEGIREFYGILRELRAQGATVVLTSHILAEIQERVDRLALMMRGKVQAIGSVRQLREQTQLSVTFVITPYDGEAPGLREVLARCGDCAAEREGDALLIRCAKDHKMRVLAALSGVLPEGADLQVREPSLEDIFLGYANLNPASAGGAR